MESKYTKKSFDDLIVRINSLSVSNQALWGKMNVNQMLKHSIGPLDVASGDLKLNVILPFRILGRLMKKSWFNADDVKKNSPTANELIANGTYDFEETKNELISKLNQYTASTDFIKVYTHPFWGKLSVADWDTLIWKHTDHHLRQFGA